MVNLQELASQLYNDATIALWNDFESARNEEDSDIVVDSILAYYGNDKRVIDFFSLIPLSFPEPLSDEILEEMFDLYTDEHGMSLRDYLTESVMAGFPV